MTETDISKVLIEGDYATIMGVKYKRVEEPKSPVEEDGDLRGTVVNFKCFYLYKNEARLDDIIPFTYEELETLPWTEISSSHSI